MKLLAVLFEKLRVLSGKVPTFAMYDPTKVEFQYVAGSCLPDVVHVFYNKKFLFTYNWIDGVDAKKHSELEKWVNLKESK